MSRRFSASNDEVRYPIQAGSNFTGAWSKAVLLARASATLQWQAVIGHHDSSGAYQTGFEISGQPNPQDHVVAAFNASTTAYGTTRAQSSDGWVVLGVSKAAGSGVAPRAHIYKAGAWTHEAVSTTIADAATQAGGSIRLGELADVDDFDGWIAADAGWASDIGDAGFVALTANLRIADWVAHATAPAYVHQHNQATAGEDILDLMGNGHVATGTITGTTDAVGIAGTTMDPANDPPGWTYFGASGLVIPVRRRGPNRRFLRGGPLAQVERRAPATTAAGQGFTITPSGVLAPAGALSKTTAAPKTGAISPAGAVSKLAAKTLAGGVTPSGALALAKVILKALAGAISPTGALAKLTSKPLAGSSTPAGSPAKQAQKRLAGITTPAGALTKLTTKLLAGAISPAGAVALARVVLKALAGAIAPAGALRKQPGKQLAATTTPTGALRRDTTKQLLAAVTPAGALAKQIARRLAGAIAPAGALIAQAASAVWTLLRLHSWDHRAVDTRTHDHGSVSTEPHDHPADDTDASD
jgi:hypothetical protein